MSLVIYTKLSPNKKLLAIGNYARVVLIDLESKQVYKQFFSQRDFAFKNDSILYVMSEGIYEININTEETRLIWKNEADTDWPKYEHIYLGYESKFSFDAKYAIVIIDSPCLFDLNKGEIINWYFKNSIPVFNPFNHNEFIFYGGERIDIYSFEDIINPIQKIYLDPHIQGENYMKLVNDCNYYALVDYRSIRLFNSINYLKEFEIEIVGKDFILIGNKIYINKVNYHYLYDVSTQLNILDTDNNKINVFPNPNDGTFDLVLDIQKSGYYKIKIINSIGQELISNNVGYLTIGHNTITNELLLPNGKYYITITNGIDFYNSQFIINK